MRDTLPTRPPMIDMTERDAESATPFVVVVLFAHRMFASELRCPIAMHASAFESARTRSRTSGISISGPPVRY